LYSLGCTLYCLLAGRPPFREDTWVKIILAHQEKQPQPLPELRPDVPAELWQVMARLLAKEPAQRYQKPIEAAQALAPFVKSRAKQEARGASTLPRDMGSPRKGTVIETESEIKKILGGVPGMASSKEVPAREKETSRFADLTTASVAPKEVGRLRESTQPSRAPWWKRPGVLAGAVGVSLALILPLILLAIIIIRVRTPEGTIVLENLPSDADVTVDGNSVTVKWVDGKTAEIRVAAGKKQWLEVKKDGFKVRGEEVELEAGGRKSVLVRLEPGVPLVNKRFPAEILPPGQPTWRIDGDELVQSSVEDRTQGILFGDPNWVDYDFSVDAKMVEGRPGCECLFRRLTEWKQYTIALDGANKWFWIRPTWTGNRSADQSYKHTEPRSIAKDRWYHVEIRVRGQHCDAFIDGEKIFTFTADDLPPRGRVGLQTWATSCRFRNIIVKDPKGKILLEGLPDLRLEPKQRPPEPLQPKHENEKTKPIAEKKEKKGAIDLFPPMSTWKGTLTYRKGAWVGATVAYEIHIRESDGKKFKGVRFDKRANRGDIEGEVKGETITWRENIHGADVLIAVEGKLTGDSIHMTFIRSYGNGSRVEGDGKLKRDGS
jgi:hypothetical protein